MKRKPPILIRVTRFLLGYKLTPIGRVAVLGITTSAIGGVTVEIPIYQIFCGLVCLFGVIEATGMLLRPKLEVSAWMPSKVTAGDAVTGYVTVVNRGYFPAYDVMCTFLGLPESLRQVDGDRVIRTIPSGEQAVLPYTIEANERGKFDLPAGLVHSTFPFNILRFGKWKTGEQELLVLPSFSPLEHLGLPFTRKLQGSGVIVDVRPGDSPEFIGNRDYISGEPVRRLDFKAWARIGRPVVREFQDEVTTNIGVVLDTHLPHKSWWSRKRQLRQLDAAVNLTAAIAHQIDQRSIVIETFLAGADLFLFPPSSTTTHFESLLDVLAEVEEIRNDPLPSMSPILSDSLQSVAVTICILLSWSESRMQFIKEIVASGSAVKVIVVANAAEVSLGLDHPEDVMVLDPDDILSGAVLSL